MLAWVIGSGGLLGSSVEAAARTRGATIFDSSAVPWASDGAAEVLRSDVQRFRARAGSEPWCVYWAAGAAVVATDSTEADRELAVFRSFADALADTPPSGPGALFLASSAGAVYAGSGRPPFDVLSETVANSPYGELKLAQEEVAGVLLAPLIPVVVGRISNLYGPRTAMEKSQGLVFHLCRSAALRQSLNLYVPLETLRDYVFADDAADVIVEATTRRVGAAPGVTTEIIASGAPASVASVVATVERVTHRRVPIALGTHRTAGRQVMDLRLVPTLRADRTPFPTGVRRVFDALVGRAARPQSA